jgi:hypothetical protein
VKWKAESNTSLLWIHGKCAPPTSFAFFQILIIFPYCSGFGEEHPLVCYQLSFIPEELTLPISSAIIRDILVLREAGLASMAYFYFDFRDTNNQNLRTVLPSLLTQLSACSDHYCDILYRVYKAHAGTVKPCLSTMIACLKEMLTTPNQSAVYLILEALDECANNSGPPSARKQVLDLLKDLVGLRLSKLHICVTSCPEIDIRAALEPLAFHSVSIDDQSRQKKDVEDYVRRVVYADSNTAMRRWRENDKELVIETLTARADR